MSKLEAVISRLDRVRKQGSQYIALCPAHPDRSPSLSVGEGTDGRVLIKCWSGCGANAVVEAIGLSLSDLFPETDKLIYRPVPPKPTGFDDLDHAKWVLAIAKSDREAGRKLSKADLETERKAFITLKKGVV